MRTSTAAASAVVIALCSVVTSNVVTSSPALGAVPAQDKPAATTQAARPQRTEAEARQLAEKHRQDRARLAKETGKPVELISDYVKARMLPVPESLGVSPFYTKSGL